MRSLQTHGKNSPVKNVGLFSVDMTWAKFVQSEKCKDSCLLLNIRMKCNLPSCGRPSQSYLNPISMTLEPGLLPWSLRVTGVRAVLSSKDIQNLSSKPWTLAWQGWSLGGAPTVYSLHLTYIHIYTHHISTTIYMCVSIWMFLSRNSPSTESCTL